MNIHDSSDVCTIKEDNKERDNLRKQNTETKVNSSVASNKFNCAISRLVLASEIAPVK